MPFVLVHTPQGSLPPIDSYLSGIGNGGADAGCQSNLCNVGRGNGLYPQGRLLLFCKSSMPSTASGILLILNDKALRSGMALNLIQGVDTRVFQARHQKNTFDPPGLRALIFVATNRRKRNSDPPQNFSRSAFATVVVVKRSLKVIEGAG